MAGPRGEISAGRAFVEIYLKNAKLLKGLKEAQQRLRDFGNGMAAVGKNIMAVGASITAPLLAATKIFSDTGSKLNDMSKRTGTSTEALSELGYAAELSGSSIEGVETSLKKMLKIIGNASTGNKEAITSIEKLGISLKDLEGKTPDQQLELFADALSKITDPAKRTAFAMNIFGKSGTELLPIMEDGAAGIKKMREEAKQLGVSIGTDQAKAADELGDAWDRMTKAAKAAAFQVGAALAKPMTEIAESVKNLMVSVNSWIKQNSDVIIQTVKLGTEITALGIAFFAVGEAISIAAGAIEAFRAVILFVATAGIVLTGEMSLLAVGLGAIAAAFVNAKLKGISFGDSVLDWIDQITGLNTGLSRFDSNQKKQNRRSNAIGGVESGDAGQSRSGMVELNTERTALQLELRNLQNRKAAYLWPWEWDPEIKQLNADIKATKNELTLLESNIKRLESKHAKNVIRGFASRGAGGVNSIIGGIMGAGSRAGDALKPYFDRMRTIAAATSEAQLELRRIQASGIASPLDRDTAMANIDYDAKRRKIQEDMQSGKAGPENIFLNEQLRAAELASIRQRYDRETAEKRLEMEKETTDEIARLKIENTMKGKEKELALLKLREQQEIEEAKKTGLNLEQIRQKYILMAQLAGMTENMGKVSGTFSGSELAGMGVGNVQERVAKAVERQLAKQDRQIKLNEDMLNEQKRLTLESVA